MKLHEALHRAAHRLGTDSARRDAELLMLHVLGLSRAELLANPAREMSENALSEYEEAVERRLRHEPIQYITGVQEFYGLPLRVTPAVLIPRPETEHLVEAVLERLPRDRSVEIVDIGTGSGAIAIALAKHLPAANVTALDLSPSALEIAQANANALGVAGRIRCAVSDLLESLDAGERREHFDAIVSNPPYVPMSEAPELHPQVREYEPWTALFAGDDGLDVYRRLIPQAREALKEGGWLALELGHGQSIAVGELLTGWRDVGFVNDLQKIPRVALARK